MTNCSATQIEREFVVEGSTKWFVHVVRRKPRVDLLVKLEKQKLRRQVELSSCFFTSKVVIFWSFQKKSRLTHFFPNNQTFIVSTWILPIVRPRRFPSSIFQKRLKINQYLIAHISSWTFLGNFRSSFAPNGFHQKNPPTSMPPTSGSTLALGGYPSEWGNCPVIRYLFWVDTSLISWEPPKNHRPFFSGTNGVGLRQFLNQWPGGTTSGKKVPFLKKSPWTVDSMDSSRVKRMKHKLFVQQNCLIQFLNKSCWSCCLRNNWKKTMVT